MGRAITVQPLSRWIREKLPGLIWRMNRLLTAVVAIATFTWFYEERGLSISVARHLAGLLVAGALPLAAQAAAQAIADALGLVMPAPLRIIGTIR